MYPSTERLIKAADRLDYLYEGSKHIPRDLAHSEVTRGLVVKDGRSATNERPVAQFFWGGAAEVFVTLGPAVLPLLATLLRKTAADRAGVPSATVLAALAFADHVLKEES